MTAVVIDRVREQPPSLAPVTWPISAATWTAGEDEPTAEGM